MQAKDALHQFIARTQLLERLPWILAALLIAALGYRMAELTWRVVPITESEEIIPPEPAVATTDRQTRDWGQHQSIEFIRAR